MTTDLKTLTVLADSFAKREPMRIEVRMSLCDIAEIRLRNERTLPTIMEDATSMLNAMKRGDTQATEQLLTLVYDELRKLAAFKMSQEAPGQTLQPTALVHEAWLCLIGAGDRKIDNRAHFFSVAAEAMRRILIDRVRRKRTQRHGGDFERVELEGLDIAARDPDDELLAVHEALEKLACEHPRQAELVKLRYFAGMTNEEAASLLRISVSTAKADRVFARARLFDEIEGKLDRFEYHPGKARWLSEPRVKSGSFPASLQSNVRLAQRASPTRGTAALRLAQAIETARGLPNLFWRSVGFLRTESRVD
jgi:RNA polymerase sigma factor (TIGR02999 family)